MPGLSFLSKKSWHTSNVKNVEKVWIAEQEKDEEAKKLRELQKQLEDERQIKELRQLQAASGQTVKTIDNSLDWMYTGPASQSEQVKQAEDYLLGKIFKPKQLENQTTTIDDTQSLLNKSNSSSSSSNWVAKVNTKNDTFTRIHEDPMLVIKKKEKEARDNVVNNPVKMARIYHELERQLEQEKVSKKASKQEKKEKKGKKKSHKEHKSRKEKSDKVESDTKRFIGSDSDSTESGEDGEIEKSDRASLLASSSQQNSSVPSSDRDRVRRYSRDLDYGRYDRDRDHGRDRDRGRGRDNDMDRDHGRGRDDTDRDRDRNRDRDHGRDNDRNRDQDRNRSRSPDRRTRARSPGTSHRDNNHMQSDDIPLVSHKVTDSSSRSRVDTNDSRYGLQSRNSNQDSTDRPTDKSVLGPDPRLLAQKIEKERLEQEAVKAKRQRENVKTLDEEERVRRIKAMESDASVFDDRRFQQKLSSSTATTTTLDKRDVSGSATTSGGIKDKGDEKSSSSGAGDATFLRQMRSEVYNSIHVNMEDRLKQQRHYVQSSADMENKGFLKK